MQGLGKYLIIIGVLIIVIGLILHFFGASFKWFGNLPGDIRVERENFRFYFPITTMILLNLFIGLIIYLIRKFL